MKTTLLLLFALGIPAVAAAQAPTPAPTATPAPVATSTPAPKPVAAKREQITVRSAGGLTMGHGAAYETKRLACKEVRFSWLAGDQLSRGPELLTVVKDEAGASGIQFFRDGVKTWSSVGGVTNVQSIFGMPGIDWIDCHDSEPMGGIWVEYFDSKLAF